MRRIFLVALGALLLSPAFADDASAQGYGWRGHRGGGLTGRPVGVRGAAWGYGPAWGWKRVWRPGRGWGAALVAGVAPTVYYPDRPVYASGCGYPGLPHAYIYGCGYPPYTFPAFYW